MVVQVFIRRFFEWYLISFLTIWKDWDLIIFFLFLQQTNTADMLEEAVEYVKALQCQIQVYIYIYQHKFSIWNEGKWLEKNLSERAIEQWLVTQTVKINHFVFLFVLIIFSVFLLIQELTEQQKRCGCKPKEEQ